MTPVSRSRPSSFAPPSRRGLLAAACAAGLLGALPAAQAQSPAHVWPEAGRPIRIVVGFPPGGGVDVLARAVAAPLAAELGGATVIVENRAGAGGLTGTDYVAKSAPDGYTVYLATPGSFTIWPSLRKLPYDAGKDFVAVSLMVTMPNLLLASPNAPFKDVRGLIAAGKVPGTQIDYGSGGVATIGQIAAEQFNTMAGIRMTHVPYKGTAPLLTDVMGGVVPVTFADPSAKSLIEGGKLRLLAVTTAKRSRLFPDTPTIAESGLPGYDLMNWYGMVAPAATPRAVVDRLNAGMVKVMAQPEVRQRLEAAGMEAASSTPDEFNRLMAGERAKWAALIAKVGMQAE